MKRRELENLPILLIYRRMKHGMIVKKLCTLKKSEKTFVPELFRPPSAVIKLKLWNVIGREGFSSILRQQVQPWTDNQWREEGKINSHVNEFNPYPISLPFFECRNRKHSLFLLSSQISRKHIMARVQTNRVLAGKRQEWEKCESEQVHRFNFSRWCFFSSPRSLSSIIAA